MGSGTRYRVVLGIAQSAKPKNLDARRGIERDWQSAIRLFKGRATRASGAQLVG